MKLLTKMSLPFMRCSRQKGPEFPQNNEMYFYWYAEISKKLNESKITALKDSLQKANGKLKQQTD